MKYFTNLFVFLAWYLDKISDIHATSTTQEEQIQKLDVFERWKSDLIPELHIMIALKRNVVILALKEIYNVIYSENTIRISVTETNAAGYSREILKAPDGVFDVPSYTITSAGRICQLDVSDPMKPRINDFINNSLISSYSPHVWINKNEFLVQSYGKLLHFTNKNNETKKWNSKEVSRGTYFDMIVFQYDPKSFVVVYSRYHRNEDILVMWPEDALGKPGDWRNEAHIKEAHIKNKIDALTSTDVNNDGKTDLLISFEFKKEIDGKQVWYVDVRAYEIPHSEEFKNPGKYKEHVLITYLRHRSNCFRILKAFIPFVSYKGKPWILVGECNASYLQPENDEVGNWNYKRNLFFTGNGSIVRRIEVVDIDQDGNTDLFLLADRLYVYSFTNRTITDPPPTNFICVVSVIIIIIILVVAFLLYKFGYHSRLAEFLDIKKKKNMIIAS